MLILCINYKFKITRMYFPRLSRVWTKRKTGAASNSLPPIRLDIPLGVSSTLHRSRWKGVGSSWKKVTWKDLKGVTGSTWEHFALKAALKVFPFPCNAIAFWVQPEIRPPCNFLRIVVSSWFVLSLSPSRSFLIPSSLFLLYPNRVRTSRFKDVTRNAKLVTR